jgi:hypothetical protein
MSTNCETPNLELININNYVHAYAVSPGLVACPPLVFTFI